MSTEVRNTDDDTGAWILLAQTRTIKLLGKRLAGRDAQADEPNYDWLYEPGEACEAFRQ